MRKLVFALLVSCALVPIKAQDITIKIHGHPQKQFYNSESEWPEFEPQCHGAPSVFPFDNTNPFPKLQHTHLYLKAPVYAELNGPINIEGWLKTFQLVGRTDDHINGLTNVRFDNSGTSTPQILRGDPNGLIVQHFTATIPSDYWPKHGTFDSRITIRTYFDNGGIMDNESDYSFYSMLDPSQPETNVSSSPTGVFVATRCNLRWESRGTDNLATVAMEARSYLPITPFDKPFPISLAYYTYGSSFQSELAPGFAENSLDADLHMGNEGTQIFTFQVPDGANDPGSGPFFPCNTALCNTPGDNPYYIYPDQIGAGNHSINFRWKQSTGKGSIHFEPNLENWALIRVPIIIGDTIPIPPPVDPCIADPFNLSISWPMDVLVNKIVATDNRSCTRIFTR